MVSFGYQRSPSVPPVFRLAPLPAERRWTQIDAPQSTDESWYTVDSWCAPMLVFAASHRGLR